MWIHGVALGYEGQDWEVIAGCATSSTSGPKVSPPITPDRGQSLRRLGSHAFATQYRTLPRPQPFFNVSKRF